MKVSDLIQKGGGRALRKKRLTEFLQRVNDTRSAYPREATVSGVFRALTAHTPEATALIFRDRSLSYGDLARMADGLAAVLIDSGLPFEGPVGLLFSPSPEAIGAMLGTLAAGGAYVPLLPDSPFERLAQQVRDCRTTVIITEASSLGLALRLKEQCEDLQRVFVPDGESGKACTGDRSRPDGLAYIMYTSGTQGTPKGVMVEHRGILRLVLHTNWISLSAEDRLLLTGSLGFDASTFEIWGALLNGGALVIPERDQLLDPGELCRLIRTHRVTTLWLTAGFFNALASNHADVFATLRNVISGGERVSAHHFRLVQRAYPGIVLKNGYGPTENTTFTTVHDFVDDGDPDVAIGRPISNTTVHILDEKREPVEIGVTGELYAGGDGLARGYLNDPTLTGARFVWHPAAGRLYRTGDLARWRPDGTVRYMGRMDDQLKIRGHRIEPGEIETCILGFPGIRECAVGARPSQSDEIELIAWFTASEAVNSSELRAFVASSLPDWMIPVAFEELPALPLSANSKLDRPSLPAPRERTVSAGPPEPENQTERELVGIWREVLQRDSVGVSDDFFTLGGHSLGAVKLIWLVQQRLSFTLPFTILLKTPTIRAMARRIVDEARFGNAYIDDPLVSLTPGRTGPSVFAFPPGTGDALSYTHLAQRLSSYRIYAFNFIEGRNILKTWADLIVNTEPVGSYRLFGYSGGGNFAFRTAALLESRGKKVAGVAMLDSSRFMSRYRFPADESRRLAAEFLSSVEVLRHASTGVLQDKVMRTIESYYDLLSGAVDDTIIDAPIHVISGSDSIDEYRDDNGTVVCSKPAWAQVTRSSFRLQQGFGEHGRMLHGPFLEDNVSILQEVLGKWL